MTRQTPTEHMLKQLIPTKYESTVDKRDKILRAVEWLKKQNRVGRSILTPIEQNLAKGFIAALIYEFVTDSEIYGSTEPTPTTTSLVECGKNINISKIRPILNRGKHTLSGLGVAIWDVSITSFLVFILDEVVELIFDKDYSELIRLKDFEQINHHTSEASSKSTQASFKKQALAKISNSIDGVNDAFNEKLLRDRNPYLAIKLFLYIKRPSPPIWLKAWNTLMASEMSEYTHLQKIMFDSAGEIKAESEYVDAFVESLSLLQTQTRQVNQSVFLGKLAQKNDEFVDFLVEELSGAPPPKSMDIAHGLLIAAQENSYATRKYIDVVSDKDLYPNAQSEYFIVSGMLDYLSIEPLEVLFSEASKTAKKSKQSYQVSRQQIAQEVLNNLAGLRPETKSYLMQLSRKIDDPYKLILIEQLIKRNADFLSVEKDGQSVLNPQINLEQKLTISATDYGLKFLTIDLPGGYKDTVHLEENDKWIGKYSVSELMNNPPLPSDGETLDFLLHHLYPKAEEKSWLEKIKTGDFPHDMAIDRTNTFVCMAVLRSPLLDETHLSRLLGAMASKKIKGEIRTYMIMMLLELNKNKSIPNEYKIFVLKHLEILLSNKSYEVNGASMFVIGEMVDNLGNDFPCDVRNRMITIIERKFVKAKLRNHKIFGGIRGSPASTLRRMANSVLIKLKSLE